MLKVFVVPNLDTLGPLICLHLSKNRGVWALVLTTTALPDTYKYFVAQTPVTTAGKMLRNNAKDVSARAKEH